MDAIILCVLIFLAGVYFGRKSAKKKIYVDRQDAPSVQKTVQQPKPYVPPKKFRDSRWEDRDELFWNMMQEGVFLQKKRSGYLLSEVENIYRENLESWFGRYCYVNSQVSLGQLIDFPAQSQFSKEERKRFFAIFNGMAMDYVLVSRKTNRIVCVIELNDASHNEPERMERDRKLSALMKVSEIPFMYVNLNQIGIEPDIWSERKNTLYEFS